MLITEYAYKNIRIISCFFLIGNIFYSLSKCLENSGINIIFRVKMLLLKKVACADFNDSS